MDDEDSMDDELDKEESPDGTPHDEKKSLKDQSDKDQTGYDRRRSKHENSQSNSDTLDENHHEKHEDDQYENVDGIPAEIRPDEEDKMVNSVLDKNTHKSAKEELLDRCFKSLVDGKHGHKNAKCDDPHHGEKGGYDENEWLNEPLRREQIEFYLLKQLIGRVTRLEAQARQMLIDSMDKDLAQTLLVADRNLQIRDAFQLYGEGDEGDDALKESEDAEQNRRNHTTEAQQEHIRQLEQDTNLISGDSYDDDMLTRVRRYRSTFAEILVLSSTLLGLEGDDLKRFERWHIQLEGGSYKKWHHQRFKNLTKPPHSRRKKLEQRLRRRNMDTEGKVRPPGYKAPKERDEDDYTRSGKKKKHHHHKRKRATSSASAGQSDTPHVDQAEAEGRLSESDANAGRLPEEANHGHSRRSSRSSSHHDQHDSSSDQHGSSSHHRHHKKDVKDKDGKKKEPKKFKTKVWDAMEDELFRRTDKNVEDIIKAIPDEEEQEYLDKEKFARDLLLTSAERKKDSKQRESELKELKKEARRGELSGTKRGKRAAHEAEEGAEDEMLDDAGPSQQFDDAGAAERGEAGPGQKRKKGKKGDKPERDKDRGPDGYESPALSSDGDRDAAYGPNVWDTESDDEGPPDSDEHTDTDLGDEDTDLNSPMPSDPSDGPLDGPLGVPKGTFGFDDTPAERELATHDPSSRKTKDGLRGGPPIMQPRRQYNPGPYQVMPPARSGPVVHPAQQSKGPTKKPKSPKKSTKSSPKRSTQPRQPPPQQPIQSSQASTNSSRSGTMTPRERELRKHAGHARLDDVLNTMNAGPDHLHPYATPGSAKYSGNGPILQDDEDRGNGKGLRRGDYCAPASQKIVGGLM